MPTEVVFMDLGFPIVLVDPPMVAVRGKQVPDVNLRALQKEVFRRLTVKAAHLTGSEFSFVRKYMRWKTLVTAVALKAKSASEVEQWEAQGDKSTGMDWASESLLRIAMAVKTEQAVDMRHFRDAD